MDCYRCLIQWGLSTGQADLTTILPFPMTESFISLCCSNSYWTNAGCYVSNTAITLSQAQTDKASTRHDGPLCWLVFGKQPQWGFISNNKAVFPIAFTAFCSAATLFIRGSGTGTWYGDNANVTLTGLSCITPDYVLNGNFIAIGV